MRWIQKVNEDGTSRFEPRDEAARAIGGLTASIQGDIQSFVSPVDGSVISDRKQLREHNKKHNVVNAAEFTPEFYARKAKERADHYEGRHSKAETYARRCEVNEIINQLERKG